MRILHDNAAAIRFLKLAYPAGPWALTAIAVDKKGIETRTFRPEDENSLLKWLDYHANRSNLYWHVNPPMTAITKKAEREDIKEVVYFHVDVDPSSGTDLLQEQKRILNLLLSSKSVPPPTFIIYSGGGYQAFWKLKVAIPINGNLQLAEEAKRYNQQLEIIFGADNCHNIDRLCRLPGTINVPDMRKRKKGRVPALAKLERCEQANIYDIGLFTPAPALQTFDYGLTTNTAGLAVKLSGNIKRLKGVEELDAWGVPDRVKVMVVQGHVPDEPKQGDNSRSAWLFDCICQLVRCNVPDDVIFAVITDPDFGISGSVIDKAASIEKYAVRQIERAHEEAIDPWLRKLNERHAVIGNLGGKCRVIEEINDPALGRTRLTRQSFEDFANRYLNQRVIIGKNKNGDMFMPVGKWWLHHPQRRQFDVLVFAPGREVPGAYNLWKGFSCAAKPGDCSLYLKHIQENICGNNPEYFDYMIKWMARTIQRPDSPGQTAVVLRGKQGVGKSFHVKTFGSLFGRHFMQVSDPKHLVGSFNAHLRDTVVLFGDEAFYAGDKKHESVLKMLITEEIIAIEGKGVDVEVAPNYVHVLLASNSQWVVPAGADERRFFVLDVGDAAKQNSEYFKAIQTQMDNGGREALLHHLLHLSLEGFQVRNVPKTKALHEQKLLSLAPDEEWWYRKLQSGQLLDAKEGWFSEVPKHELVRDYMEYMKTINVMRRSNETALGKFLLRVCPGLDSFQKRAKLRVPSGEAGWEREVSRRVYFFKMPTLNACRKKWMELYTEGEFSLIEQPTLEEKPPLDQVM